MLDPQSTAFLASISTTDPTPQHIYKDGHFRGVFIERCDRDVTLIFGQLRVPIRAGRLGAIWWGFPVDASDFTLEISQPANSNVSIAAPLITGHLINVLPFIGTDIRNPVYSDNDTKTAVLPIESFKKTDSVPIVQTMTGIASGFDGTTNKNFTEWGSMNLGGNLAPSNVGAVALAESDGAGGVRLLNSARKATYLASGRMTAMPRALSRVFGGAASQQMTCVYHDITSAKLLKLLSAQITLLNVSAPVEVNIFLVHLDGVTAPSGSLAGANATLVQLNPVDPAPNAIMVAQPTVAGSNNYSVAFVEVLPGITGAASTVNPPVIGTAIELVNQNPAAEFPSQPAGSAGGYAIQINVSGVCTITCFTEMIFTEE